MGIGLDSPFNVNVIVVLGLGLGSGGHPNIMYLNVTYDRISTIAECVQRVNSNEFLEWHGVLPKPCALSQVFLNSNSLLSIMKYLKIQETVRFYEPTVLRF